MISIARAMTWEYTRQNRWKMLCALLAVVYLANLIGGKLAQMNPQAILFAQYLFTLLETIFLAVLVITQYTNKQKGIGFPAGLYTEPVPTCFLVTWHMLLGVGFAVLVYSTTALIITLHTGEAWPIIGPGLFLALVVTWMQALIWSCAGVPSLHTIMGGVLILVFIHGFNQCFGVSTFPMGMPRHPWTPPPALHPLTLGLGIAGAFGLATLGVARDRCGDRLSLTLIKQRRHVLQGNPVRQSRKFRSPIAAQCWFERCRIGRFVPGCNLFMVTFIIVLGVSGLVGTRVSEVCATLFWVLAVVNLLVYPPILGIGLGQQGGQQLTVDPFKAIQPISNTSLLWIYLRSALETTLLGWAIYVAGMLIVLAGLFVAEGRAAVDLFLATLRVLSQAAVQPGSPWYSIRFVISLRGMGSVCMWSAFALIASILLTGRHWLLIGLFTIGWGSLMLWGLLCDFGLVPQVTIEAVRDIRPWLIGLGCLGGTGTAFIVALRKSIIPRIMPWVGLGIWGILCALSIYGDILTLSGPAAKLVLVCGLLALPVVPLALAPLALTWNRHR
jgi:hypothetical protein